MSDLPKEWECVSLTDFVYSVPTGVPKFSGNRKYYSTGSIDGKEFIPEGEYSFDNRPSRANRVAKEGDVFQARMQGTDKALLIHGAMEEQLFSTGFLQLRPVAETYLSELLFYFLKSDFFLKQRDELATGSTQVALTDASADNLQLVVPPLPEQRRIVVKLERLLHRVDASKERLDKIPAILKRFRQSVLAAVCSGRLTKDWREKNFPHPALSATLSQRARELDCLPLPEGEGRGGGEGLPEGWELIELANLCKGFQYGTSTKSQTSGKIPVLRMGNLQNGKIDWTDLVYTSDDKEIEKYRLNPGDVLFNRTNSPELVGKTSIYRGEKPAIFAGYLIRIKNNPSLDSEYLNYCLNTTFAKEFCQQVKTDGVSQSNINAQKLGTFPIPLPPLPEQHAIVRRVEALFKKADDIETRYKKAKGFVDRLTQSILAKAFRGELVPQDSNDEPAAALLERIRAERGRQEPKKRGRK